MHCHGTQLWSVPLVLVGCRDEPKGGVYGGFEDKGDRIYNFTNILAKQIILMIFNRSAQTDMKNFGA